MLWYCEQSNYQPRTGEVRTSLVDVPDLDSVRAIESHLTRSVDQDRRQSMLAVRYRCEPWRGRREGRWYNIADELWAERPDTQYQPTDPNGPGGAYLRATLDLVGDPIDFPDRGTRVEPAVIPAAAGLNVERPRPTCSSK